MSVDNTPTKSLAVFVTAFDAVKGLRALASSTIASAACAFVVGILTIKSD